jgi:hypothetical protein
MNRLGWLYRAGQLFIFAAGILSGVLMTPQYSGAEKEESVQENTVERTGVVDFVHKDALVINDSTLVLDSSIQLYDKHRNKTDQSSFKKGDRVIVTSVESEQTSNRRVTSVRLAKQGKGQENSANSESGKAKPSQVIKKANGIWTN